MIAKALNVEKLNTFLTVSARSSNLLENIIAKNIPTFLNSKNPLAQIALDIVEEKTFGNFRKGPWPEYREFGPTYGLYKKEYDKMDEIHHPLRIIGLLDACINPLFKNPLPEPNLISDYEIMANAILLHDILGDGKEGAYSNVHELESELKSRLLAQAKPYNADQFTTKQLDEIVDPIIYIIDGLDRKTLVDRALWLGDKIQTFFNEQNIGSVEEFYEICEANKEWNLPPKGPSNGGIYEEHVLIAEYISDFVSIITRRNGFEHPDSSKFEKTISIHNQQTIERRSFRRIYSLDQINKFLTTKRIWDVSFDLNELIFNSHGYHSKLSHGYMQDDDEILKECDEIKRDFCDSYIKWNSESSEFALSLRETYSWYSKYVKRRTRKNLVLDDMRIAVKYLDSIELLSTVEYMKPPGQATQIFKYLSQSPFWESDCFIPENIINPNEFYELTHYALRSSDIGRTITDPDQSLYSEGLPFPYLETTRYKELLKLKLFNTVKPFIEGH
jgi:hypothetical protein